MIPQGLKPACFQALAARLKAVPYPNQSMRPVQSMDSHVEPSTRPVPQAPPLTAAPPVRQSCRRSSPPDRKIGSLAGHTMESLRVPAQTVADTPRPAPPARRRRPAPPRDAFPSTAKSAPLPLSRQSPPSSSSPSCSPDFLGDAPNSSEPVSAITARLAPATSLDCTPALNL